MDQATTKLARKFGVSLDVAHALVEAGYGNPTSIRRATKADLQKVSGIGPATANKLKGK